MRLGGLDRGECVERLAALAHGDDEIGVAEDRVAITDLAADLDDRGDARELLDPVPPGHRRVRARAAGDEADAPDLLRDLGADADLFADHVPLAEVHAAAQRVFDGTRLLVDLLEHEVLVAALLGLGRRPVDALRRALDAGAVERQ